MSRCNPLRAQHDDMVETLAPHRADEPLDLRVLPRGARGREDFFNSHSLRGVRPTGEGVIAISDTYRGASSQGNASRNC